MTPLCWEVTLLRNTLLETIIFPVLVLRIVAATGSCPKRHWLRWAQSQTQVYRSKISERWSVAQHTTNQIHAHWRTAYTNDEHRKWPGTGESPNANHWSSRLLYITLGWYQDSPRVVYINGDNRTTNPHERGWYLLRLAPSVWSLALTLFRWYLFRVWILKLLSVSPGPTL